MSKMSHKDKVKLARKLRTQEEVSTKVRGYAIPIFQTKAWEARKARIEREVAKREKRL